MKKITIRTLEELQNLNLQNLEVIEDIDIDIKLRLKDEKIEYPVHISHTQPGLTSKLSVKLALFGKSKVKMPVEMWVHKKAVDTSTHFKATVLLISAHAHADVTPGLFIHENNIQSAGHGVVIKNIKDEDLVYLRARGIRKEDAKDLIVGF